MISNPRHVAFIFALLMGLCLLLQGSTLPQAYAGKSAAPKVDKGWTHVAAASGDAHPAARVGHAMAYDPVNERIVLFGGSSEQRGKEKPLDDTWVWDGSNWAKLKTRKSPPPRTGHCMTFDHDRKMVMLFGGQGERNRLLNDTWMLLGDRWIQQHPTPRPDARRDASIAYDTLRKKAVLFGGRAKKPLDDTWEWAGLKWIQRKSYTHPKARYGHAIAYDAKRDRIVLFGGTQGGFPAFGDTWEFDGGAWKEIETREAPAPSLHASLIYDAGAERIVLHGGRIEASGKRGFNSTWQWDGRKWSQIDADTGPGDRYHGAAAFDAERGLGLFFGGRSLTKRYDETWLLRLK